MSLNDSPMLGPSHTVANQYRYRDGLPKDPLNEEMPRGETQTKEVATVHANIAVRGPPLPKPDKILTMADQDRTYDMWPGMWICIVFWLCRPAQRVITPLILERS